MELQSLLCLPTLAAAAAFLTGPATSLPPVPLPPKTYFWPSLFWVFFFFGLALMVFQSPSIF